MPDPLDAFGELPVPTAARRKVGGFYRKLIAAVPVFYATLPRQIIHGDFGRSNALVDRGQVSGILDFEFTGPDLRAIDVAAGLWSFRVCARGTDEEWPIIKAFLQGYRSAGTLTRPEVDALPTLVRLREATSLIHWIGRWRQGLTDKDDVGQRVDGLLSVDQWASAAEWQQLPAPV